MSSYLSIQFLIHSSALRAKIDGNVQVSSHLRHSLITHVIIMCC